VLVKALWYKEKENKTVPKVNKAAGIKGFFAKEHKIVPMLFIK
jgi:hypothetical protein